MNTQINTARLQLVGREHLLTGNSFVRGYRLVELLRDGGIIDPAMAGKAEELQRNEGIRPLDAFLRLGVISEDDLVELLCRELNVPATDLEDATIDLVMQLALPELPVRHLAVPWLVQNSVLHVAMADPTDLAAVQALLSKAGWRFRVFGATLSAVKRLISPGDWVPDYSHKRVLRKAKRGESAAQFEMGELNYTKSHASNKYDEAMKWWLHAAAQGHTEAAFKIGEMYDDGVGVSVNKEIAIAWYRRAAEQGHASAQVALGWIHASDAVSLRNYKEAAKWYLKAAEQGDAAAQNNLGVLCARGDGVPQDDVEAARWYRAGAEQGSECAQCNLAFAYEEGSGVLKDTAEAMKWFRASAERGNIRAQNALGDRLQNGWGIPKDEGTAVLWFWKAAQQSDAYAQYKLGKAFEHGRGVWPNRTLAMKWYREAARQGHEEARSALRRALRIARLADALPAVAQGDWELEHYPVVLRCSKHKGHANRNEKATVITWSAEILGWPVMHEIGKCEEDAYIKLQARFSAYKESGKDLLAPVTEKLLR